MEISHEPSWAVGRQKVHPKLKGAMRADVAIIGGGLTGLLTAYLLSNSGKKVVVLESNLVGLGATLYTTAFITRVVDTSLDNLIKMFGTACAKLVWKAGAEAIAMIEAIVQKEKIDCEFGRCSAYIYASNEKEYAVLEREHQIAKRLGFRTALVKNKKAQLTRYGFLEAKEQAKFHPVKFLRGVAKAVEASGGKIFEKSRALSIAEDLHGSTVKTRAGSVTAKDVVVATYMPFNNPATTKYKKVMYRSYVLEVRLSKGIFPEGLYWDSDNPYHYFRIDHRGKFDRMILGGEDHRSDLPVSREKSFAALREYLGELLSGRQYRILRQWTGGVLESVDGLPLIGAYKRHQFIATAFSGNGMTYAMVSALLLRDLISGNKNPWTKVFDPKRAFTLYRIAKKGTDYAEELFEGAIKNSLRSKAASG
jgi:glycine/D-amino acid oxidase-like deaminating enzyme